MESDVAATLSELERKLKELERELESVGRAGEAGTEPAQAGWTPPPAPVPPAADPGPPPAGTTPFTASWHGGQAHAAPPPPGFDGAPAPVPLPPPASAWPGASPWHAAAAPPPAEPHAPAHPPAPGPAPASGLQHQVDELIAFRDRLVQSTNDLVDELSRVLAELGAEVAGADAPRAPDPADTVLAGRVTVMAGPFADLTTLAAFEQALAATHGVVEVYVRALDAGHATIDVALGEPVALAAALRPTAPVTFTVTEVRGDLLVLAVTGGGAAAG